MGKTLVTSEALANSLNTIISEFRLRRDNNYWYVEEEPKTFEEAAKMRLNGKISPARYKYYCKKFGVE